MRCGPRVSADPMRRAGALAAGVALDAVAGDPARGHPVAAFGAGAVAVEGALYRDARRNGAAAAALLVGAPAALSLLAQRRLRPAPAGAVLAAVTWTALGGRSLWAEALALADAVEAGELAAARARLPALAGRDPDGLDAAGLCRAGVESVAENTADAAVGTLLYGAAAGATGVVAQRCANTLDAMVGHRSARYARYGWAAARFDDVLGWAPARATALLAAVCAPLVGGRPLAALAAWRRDAGRHPSPNAGVCEAAFAGALGLELGGAARYGGRVEQRGPLGHGRAPTPADLRRAVRLSQAVCVAALGAAGVLLALSARAAPPTAQTPARSRLRSSDPSDDRRRRRRCATAEGRR